MNNRNIGYLAVMGLALFFSSWGMAEEATLAEPKVAFVPRRYVCYRTPMPIQIDGKLTEPSWSFAPWSESFVDIEGEQRPAPRWSTKVKMVWDDERFYIAAELEEPHIWARLTQRDTVIFYDNDFEVFIDPDGDSHQYYEFEMNALNTGWDLLLIKPYRDGGPAVHGWDIQGLQTAVSITGTLNRPSDIDSGWTVELAIPWPALREASQGHFPPEAGDQWRINFSRVEWQTELVDGRYRKCINPATGKPFPEENWVWSPQGVINMHYPEMWGYVQFSKRASGETEPFVEHPEEAAKWLLRQIYYRQRNYHVQHSRFTARLEDLHIEQSACPGYQWPPRLFCTASIFEARLAQEDNGYAWCIRQDGLVWKEATLKEYDTYMEMEGGERHEWLSLEYALLAVVFIGVFIFARIAAKKRFDV